MGGRRGAIGNERTHLLLGGLVEGPPMEPPGPSSNDSCPRVQTLRLSNPFFFFVLRLTCAS